jgi:hypothetical protein
MNTMKYRFLLFAFMIAATTLWLGCDNSAPPVEESDEDSTATEEVSDLQKSTIKIPSPVELYMFMYESNAKFSKDYLNPIDNQGKYMDNYKKALNMGVYASDLAYCTVFKQNKETFAYFAVVKKIAEDLGLNEGFDESIVKRIDQNISNSDSLYNITNDSYSSAVRFLEQQGQGDLLPLMITGAWIESVFISIKSVDKFSEDNEVVLRIADQALLLENIIEIFNTLPEEDKQPELLEKLLELQEAFDMLYDNTDVIITKKQFEEISSKVKAIRAVFIG